ncbi:DUF4249 family protein [soil metagenome]
MKEKVLGTDEKILHRNANKPFIRQWVLWMLLPFHISLFTLNACSENFQPYQENDRYFFTIYGYLDASADTQWVRVAPTRGEFETPPEIPEMEVTLEHLESGSILLMNKSLIQFQAGLNALNAWSLMDVEPGNSYRLKAVRPDGKESGVSVTLPEDFPTPRMMKVEIPTFDPEYILLIDGVEHLIDVHSKWYARLSTSDWEEERVFIFSNKNNVQTISPGNYRVPIDPENEMAYIKRQLLITDIPDGDVEFLHHQIFVASGGPDWDENIPSLNDLVYALPEGLSNVENGLGYMVGIVSKLIPFDFCLDNQNFPTACPEEKPFF